MMIDDTEHHAPQPVVGTPHDPWTTVPLPPDSPQNAWLISYIDILLLLTTLLVVLLVQQKQLLGQQPQAAQTTQVAGMRQTTPPPPDPPLKNGHSMAANSPHQKQEPQHFPTPLPEKHSQPAAATTLVVPPPIIPQTALVSRAPASAAPASDAEVTQGTTAPEPQIEAVSSPVPWTLPDDLQEQVEVTREAQYIRLEVKDTLLFASASADLKAQAETLLQNLVGMLQRHTGRISVEGHTDDIPIATARYPSNWELSSARASTVARYLILHGIADRKSVV